MEFGKRRVSNDERGHLIPGQMIHRGIAASGNLPNFLRDFLSQPFLIRTRSTPDRSSATPPSAVAAARLSQTPVPPRLPSRPVDIPENW